jgi:hypothetical protein
VKLLSLFVVAISLGLSARGADTDVPRIIAGLKDTTLNYADVHALLYVPPSKEIIDSLRQAFDHYTAKGERQEIAAALIQIGDSDATYYEYLARFARVAIEDNTPFLLAYDSAGRIVKGAMNPTLEQWCKDHKTDLSAIAELQMSEYPLDVELLDRTRDPRAGPLLIEGLKSENPWVALKAAQGLALLGRVDTLPLIAKSCERLPKEAGSGVAIAFADFQSPLAEQYFAHFEPNAGLRSFWQKESVRRREDYQKQVQSRKRGQL